MKHRLLISSLLVAIALMLVSCEKLNLFENPKPTMNYISGDDKDKIDLKGSLMKPDMKYDIVYAELVDKIVYVYINETVENCLITLSAENYDVLYARNMKEQHPATIRIYMENEPTGNYRLYITNGKEEASAWFHFENAEAPNRSPIPIQTYDENQD